MIDVGFAEGLFHPGQADLLRGVGFGPRSRFGVPQNLVQTELSVTILVALLEDQLTRSPGWIEVKKEFSEIQVAVLVHVEAAKIFGLQARQFRTLAPLKVPRAELSVVVRILPRILPVNEEVGKRNPLVFIQRQETVPIEVEARKHVPAD